MSAGYILVQADSTPLPSPFPSAKQSVLNVNDWSCKDAMIAVSRTITAVGNFSIQYNFQAISVALIVMSAEQCTLTEEMCRDGKQAGWVMGTATATVFAGAILGQLTMGYLGDILDRNKAMTLTLSIACLAAISSAVLPRGSPTSVYIIIIICRFILGAGLGGVYPLSAAKAAEDAPPDEQEKENNSERNNHDLCSNGSDSDLSRIASSAETSVTFIPVSKLKAGTKRSAMAFFWQIPGSMTPWALAYLFSFLDLPVDTQWRLLLGLGSIPAAFVVVLLVFEMKNTYRHQKIKISNAEREAPGSLAKSRSALTSDELAAVFHNAFRSKIIWFKVLYTGGGWFLFDVCFYGVGLFGGEIVASISARRNESVASSASLRDTSLKQVFALSLGIPACAITIFFLKSASTKRIQTVGFLFVTFSFALLASVYEHCRKGHPSVLYGVYCLLLLSLSGGPILTTFILPAETFPKEIRATFSGIAAACGKLGAFVGAYLFSPLASATSIPCVMAVCAVLAAFGALLSHLCIGAEESVILSRKNSSCIDPSKSPDYVLSLFHSDGSDEAATANSTSEEKLETGSSEQE